MGRVVEPPTGRRGAACCALFRMRTSPVPERSRRERSRRDQNQWLFNRDKRDAGDKEMVGCGDEGTASMGRVVEPPAGRKGAACCAPTARWNIHWVRMVGCGDAGTASFPVPVTIIVKSPAAKC